uniref:Cyclic nucleotide-binding domain-containing protein n=2 Tax=Heliothis virescens TaxID=7102 RepID=A0A2A4JFL8_HELVI
MMWMWNAARQSAGSRMGSRGSQVSHGSQFSRTSYGSQHASHLSIGSVSRTRGSQHRDIEFQFFIRQTEALYPPWWTREGAIDWYRDLPDDTAWNCFICGCVLFGVVWTVTQFDNLYIDILDVIYNISYAIHVFAIGYKMVTELENTDITFWVVLGYLVDLGSFAHYVKDYSPIFKLTCYYVRLHRPFKYLWSLTDYNLKGSILGTTLKYCYIFLVIRITWAYAWLYIDTDGNLYNTDKDTNVTTTPEPVTGPPQKSLDDLNSPARRFLGAYYLINKMFIPIGPSEFPDSDIERIVCLCIMLSGCLVVTGSAVASLSLVVSLYMRPEETFLSRYRLIMKEMKDTQVPASLRDKVETFYKMYWHKQRAVSETQLLPLFPPTLPATINTDIYFEATQKARILRELSYQILEELARKMETVHYIPGDAIIKRGSKKCQIIYITYGDVEMLTAEDDSTPILRMTRGTVLTPCGCAVAAALHRSHAAVRAATFCTAHVLKAKELWRVVTKHSVSQDNAGPILASFTDHIEKVKRHYQMKVPDEAAHKSSILNFNRNLLMLKDMNEEGAAVLSSSDVFLEIAGCYIMRNRPASTLTDQSDQICLRPVFPCILQPRSSLLVGWHAFVALLIFIVCITHPYVLVYHRDLPQLFRFFDYVVTSIYTLDLIVHLSTGANVEEGVPITFAQTSSQQMRSHWFVLDVVATLPVFEFVGNGQFAGINKILRLPKLFRVLKSFEESCGYRSHVLRFLSYTLLLLIACYLIATMQQAFMCFQSGYCLVTNFTHRPFWENKPLDEETVQARLIFGLYWAISMINFSIHRETWGKENWQNVLYTMVILEICIVLRIFMEAVYSATIMVTTDLRENYGSRIAMVKSFLIRNEMDPLLRKRFITYLQLCWHTDQAYKMTHRKHSNIFYDLPAHVYQDIVGRNRSKYILVIPFMKFLSKEDLRVVSSVAKLFYTSPNEILLNTGELSNEIYIIKRGICEIVDPISKKRIGTLTSKSHFAALICLLRIPAYYTVRAITHVQVFCIPRKHLDKVFEHPQIKEAVEYLKRRPEYQRVQTKLPAFLKYVEPPRSKNVMHFKLPRKHEPDYEYLHPFDRLGFLSVLRYVFPRYTIRPDGKYLLRYEWFRVICALLSAQLFPHYTYLVLQWPYLYHVSMFLDLSAYFDIFQRMMIGYFNTDGILVYHPASTAAYYLKSAFLADLFACLPLENLESSRKDSFDQKFRLTPTKQFLMLNRLIQLYRMPSAMMVLKEYIERRDILMVFQAIPLFMAMLNALTCLMVFYSVKIFYSRDADGNYDWLIEPYQDKGGSWVYLFKDKFRFNFTSAPWNLHLATYFWVVFQAIPLFMAMLNALTCLMVFYSVKIFYSRDADGNYDWLIEPYQDKGGSWVYLFKDKFRFNFTSAPWNLHLATYFWVVYECSSTGYGIFNPSNHEIMQLLFVGVACCAMIITYYSVRIISIRANVNKSLAGFQQHMKDINVYMAREKLDTELQKEIQRFYEYNWEKMGGVDYRGVLKLCDQITLRTDAILHIYGHTFTKCPLLANADISLLRIIGRAVRSVYFLRDMKILEMDDMATDMYFVDYGGVEVRVNVGDNYHVIRLPRGSVFGNLEGTDSHRSPYNVIATGRLHLLMIKSNIFSSITKDFPAVRELMEVSKSGIGKNTKMYVLGGEAKVRVRHNLPSGPPRRGQTSVLKYIYFQEGYVQIFLIAICMSCIYLDMYNAGYQDNSAWMLITLYSLDFAFFTKIFTQHSLPFLVPNKNIKQMMLPIRKMYFKGEFRYDFISIIPFELFSLAAVESRWFLFSWLRLNRTFRIATVHKCLRKRNESITVNLTVTTIMAVLIWFTLFVHAITCIWYFIGTVEDSIEPFSSWKYLDDGSSHCDNHYICSVYFVITTFTQNGVGDIMPKKHSEVLFVAILQIISTMIFMVYVGEFSNIIQYTSYRSFGFYYKYLELQEFLKNNRVSQHLVNIVNKYTLHLWRENRGLQVPHFLEQAPLSLRLRIMSAAYYHHITRHHIFEECDAAFLRQLVGCLKVYTYNEGMYVVKESDITDAMYVIHTGKVKETCEEMDISARVYPAGSYFGIMQGLLRNTPYSHSYQTVIKSCVLTLQLDDWEYLLKHFPDSRDAIHKHMRQLGDDDSDKSNWPGGAPVEWKAAEYVPMVEIPEDTPLEAGLFPGIKRHFGRDSEEYPEGAVMSRKSSLHFPWPTQSHRQSEQHEAVKQGEETLAVEEHRKLGFFEKIIGTAKKLMGKVSDSDLLAMTGEGRDELQLEEDEEATEALLAQFEAAKKMTEKDKKKLTTRRKSMFYGEDVTMEKQLVTLDVSPSMTDELGKEESQAFTMRPLRIRDSDTELITPSQSAVAPEVLNLGRSKSKVLPEVTMRKIGEDTANAEPEVTPPSRTEQLNLTQTALKFTDSTTGGPTISRQRDEEDEDSKLQEPADIQESSKIQVALDMAKTSPASTDTVKEDVIKITSLEPTDSKSTEKSIESEKPDLSKSASVQESSEIQIASINMMKTASGDTAATTEEVLEAQTTLGDLDSKPAGIPGTSVDQNTPGTFKDKKSAEDSKTIEDSKSSPLVDRNDEEAKRDDGNAITEELNLLYPELLPTKPVEPEPVEAEATTKQTKEDAEAEENTAGPSTMPDIEEVKISTDSKIPSEERLSKTLKLTDTTEEMPSTSLGRDATRHHTIPDIFHPGTEAAQHPARNAKRKLSARETKKAGPQPKVPKVKDILRPQETESFEAVQETSGVQTIEKTHPAVESTGVQAKEKEPAHETKSTQATSQMREKPDQDTISTQAGPGIKAFDTKQTQASTSKGPPASPSSEKFISYLSNESIAEELANQPSQYISARPNEQKSPNTFAEEAARKRSFSRKPIVFDPNRKSDSDNEISKGSSLNTIKQPAASASDVKLMQFMSETEDPTLASKETVVKSKTEKGTPTSTTKLNRRFIHVRYDDKNRAVEEEVYMDEEEAKEEHMKIITLDSDELQARSQTPEDDESSVSTVGSRENINSPYYDRRRSD